MRFILTLFILTGCAYKDQPPEIQKLKVEKVQTEESSSSTIGDESVEVVEESRVEKEYEYDSEKIKDNMDDGWEIKLDEIRKKEFWCAEQVKDVLASKTGSLIVGIKDGECIFKNTLTGEKFSLEELLSL